MIFRKRLVLSLLLTSTLGQQGPCQDQEPDRERLVRAISSGAVGLQRWEGRWIGLGHGYTASFDAQAMTFTPSLGPAAPRVMPLEIATLSAGRDAGTAVRGSGTSRVCGPEREGMRLVYERDGFTELWHVRPDGVEQSFEFDRLPPGEGELVVRCAIDTDLPTIAATDDEVRFGLEGIGGVRIGGVVGIDANGERAKGSMRLVDDELELRLPAGFAEDAALPLVLDPLVSVWYWSTGSSAGVQDNQATAMSSTTLGVRVYEEIVSSGFRQMRMVGIPRERLLFLGGNAREIRPSVAVQGAGRFVLAWRNDSTGSERLVVNLFGVDASGILLTGRSVELSGGIELFDVGSGVLVYTRDGMPDLRVRAIRAWDDTAPLLGPAVSVPSGANIGHLSVTKSFDDLYHASGPPRFLVWEDVPSSTGSKPIRAALLLGDPFAGEDFTPQGPITVASDWRNRERPEVAIDAQGRKAVVVYERENQPESGDKDIAAATLGLTDSAQPWPYVMTPERILEADAEQDERRPSIAILDGVALVAHEEAVPAGWPPGAYRVLLSELDPYSLQVCGIKQELPLSGHTEKAYVDGMIPMPDEPGPRAALITCLNDPAPGVLRSPGIVGFSYKESPRYKRLGPGCNGGGLADAPCATISNPSFAFRLVRSRPRKPVYVVFGAVPDAVPGPCCGTLLVHTPSATIVPTMTDMQGNASVAAPIPPGLVSSFLHYQWLVDVPAPTCRESGLSTAERARIGW